MSKVSRWWSSVVTYEKGVGRNIAVSLNRSRWWKVVATMMVAVAVFGVLGSDYFETAEKSVSEHGVKAATTAIGAAAMFFVNMIGRDSRTRRASDQLAQLVSGGLALLAGWFWLEAETGGNPWPFLNSVFLYAGTLAILAFLFLFLGVLWRAEDDYIEQRRLDQFMKQLSPPEREQFQQVIDFFQNRLDRTQQDEHGNR